MKSALVLRLVDITLLLLLSLMAIASIDPYTVAPPRSTNIEPEGTVQSPLTVALTPEGALLAHNEGGGEVSLTPQALATHVQGTGQVIEVVADRQARASVLLDLHHVLDAAGVQAVFMVQRTTAH